LDDKYAILRTSKKLASLYKLLTACLIPMSVCLDQGFSNLLFSNPISKKIFLRNPLLG